MESGRAGVCCGGLDVTEVGPVPAGHTLRIRIRNIVTMVRSRTQTGRLVLNLSGKSTVMQCSRQRHFSASQAV